MRSHSFHQRPACTFFRPAIGCPFNAGPAEPPTEGNAPFRDRLRSELCRLRSGGALSPRPHLPGSPKLPHTFSVTAFRLSDCVYYPRIGRSVKSRKHRFTPQVSAENPLSCRHDRTTERSLCQRRISHPTTTKPSPKAMPASARPRRSGSDRKRKVT